MISSIITRKKIEVKGIVQGVGFRPFIYKLAKRYGLVGFVLNNTCGVEIEVEGDEDSVLEFIDAIEKEAPLLSSIETLKVYSLQVLDQNDFEIKKSTERTGNNTFISPDVAVCDDCRRELFEENDRRYLYPFINCTNCGPRFTIIEDIPYDRPFTSMKYFEMCDDCREEYENPADRRFHAQPNACPKCGPKIWLENSEVNNSSSNPIQKLTEYLVEGKIAAIKGLGGFHLAVDANNNKAVKRLRQKKNREAKPLAVMVPDIETLKQIADCNNEEEKLLQGIEHPILLLKKKPGNKLAEEIAPGNKRLGIMLPYTPLHYVILESFRSKISQGFLPSLVMTSANLSEDPIVIKNDDAKQRLRNIADGFLMHDRDILIRSDDSVVIRINNKNRIIRRSRGYVPKAFPLLLSQRSILGLGAELKNTVCITKENNAFISQHIGDLTNLRAYNFFRETIEHMQKIVNINAEHFAHDLHPDYLSTKWVLEKNGHKSFAVQHHHAHMASCMLEHKLDEKVIGIILDGTGFGYDDSIWGGEVLIGDYTSFERFAHLEKFPLPGGDASAKEPWRIALSYLYEAYDKKIPGNFFNQYPSEKIIQMIEKNINSINTSSCGRLFDAISFIAGGPGKIRYEAEGAIWLTQSVTDLNIKPYSYDKFEKQKKEIPLKKLIREIFEDVKRNVPVNIVANKFHSTLVEIFINVCKSVLEESGINKVVLSGGVFQNEVLLTLMENKLSFNGFKVYSHSKIPTNDGGISFGQIAVAAKLIEQNLDTPIFYN